MSSPSILHVDMDAFYASIEQRDHPEYRGKPLIVGSPPNQRGIVSTCSYEARKFGVHSAMPSRTAGKLCPHGIYVPPNIKKYSQESKKIMAILHDFTPQVEVISIDEAFLDVSSVRNLLGNEMEIAKKIKQRISTELQLTASVGVAPNKFLAKLASDLQKPNGLTLITDENKLEILAPLSVSKLWGVGKVTFKTLEDSGYKTIGDIQKTDINALRSIVGSSAEHLYHLSMGVDSRKIETTREAKSIGNEHTFDTDTADPKLLRKTLLAEAERIAIELREENVASRTITLKLRYSDFTTLSRQVTLEHPTQDEVEIYNHALKLFEDEKTGFKKIRLIGISASKLSPPVIQLDLFDPSREKRQRLATAIDAVRAKLGPKAIKRVVE